MATKQPLLGSAGHSALQSQRHSARMFSTGALTNSTGNTKNDISQLHCFSFHICFLMVFAQGCTPTTPQPQLCFTQSRTHRRRRTAVCLQHSKPQHHMRSWHRDRRVCTDRRLDTPVRKTQRTKAFRRTTARCATPPIRTVSCCLPANIFEAVEVFFSCKRK